jgi:hypothetical protein
MKAQRTRCRFVAVMIRKPGKVALGSSGPLLRGGPFYGTLQIA